MDGVYTGANIAGDKVRIKNCKHFRQKDVGAETVGPQGKENSYEGRAVQQESSEEERLIYCSLAIEN